VEFVCDVRRARATGAADVGRSNLREVFECATARDCSIAQREAPDAAPGVLTDDVVEFVNDVQRARAAGAADVGRSNGRGWSKARQREGVEWSAMLKLGEAYPTARSVRTFKLPGMLKSATAYRTCEARGVRRSMLVESAQEYRRFASV
jgi:hypothetical protein